MKKSKKILLTLTIGLGLASFAAQSFAVTFVTICFRGRTIVVADYLLGRYQPSTMGPCDLTGS